MPVGKQFANLLDREHFNEVVLPGSSVLTGVSGGADSVALLLGLLALAPTLSLRVRVAHINHGLRPEADQDENFVRDLCLRFGVEFFASKMDVLTKPSNVSPEQFWREQRYGEFEKLMSKTQSDFLALGHNLDDLAETFLYHLARGTGVNGLVFQFLKESGTLSIIRPLWKTDRNRIEDALREAGQAWVSDSSNSDLRYSRNLIRHQVLPALREINPSVTEAIARVSDDLWEISDVGKDSVGQIFLSLNELAVESDRFVVGSAIRRFVLKNGGAIMDRRQTSQAVDMIQKWATGLVSLSGKHTLVVTQNKCWIYPGAEPSNKQLAEFHGQIFGGFLAEISDMEEIPKSSPATIRTLDGMEWLLEWGEAEALVFRNRRAGDRVGSKLLSKLMIDHRVPWYGRDFMVVAIDSGGEILWVADGPPALNDRIARKTGRTLQVRCTKSGSRA